MGISFSIPCDPCINKISNWSDEKVACIHNLEKNLTALVTTMEELKAKRDDLSKRVTRDEDRGQQRLAEIERLESRFQQHKTDAKLPSPLVPKKYVIMGVEDPMEVQCLADNEAFDLFQKKVGQRTLGSHPEIPELARIVAKKCCGLPLALNVIGETMSCKRTIQEWRHAIDVLTSYAIEFSGMEDKILPF
ncbi:unnamed protein product [Microthlaspi erraticum]|uniref:Uncharacterized protein n=1 Tax=Microthlaspi erraticum TaxID=1685480 RepID=A0A6D2JAZ1_9BRAS|nr:unnamed protein product [Microthlaspi erraticum]